MVVEGKQSSGGKNHNNNSGRSSSSSSRKRRRGSSGRCSRVLLPSCVKHPLLLNSPQSGVVEVLFQLYQTQAHLHLQQDLGRHGFHPW